MTNLVPDMIEANGQTVRQNNLEIEHTIPLGTLVEVDISYSDHHGIRMFICEHSRDCDGSPLYSLYHSDEFSTLFYVKEENPQLFRMMICQGFDDSCLKIIRKAK